MRYIVGFLYHKATVLHVCYMIEQLPNTEPINNNEKKSQNPGKRRYYNFITSQNENPFTYISPNVLCYVVNLNNHQSEIMNRSNPDAADF